MSFSAQVCLLQVGTKVGGYDNAVELLIAAVKNGLGALIYGPTGVGKTLLATSVAESCGLPYTIVECAAIFRKNRGEAEAGLLASLRNARACAPSVIVLDQIDLICPKREKAAGVTELQVMCVLLSELDAWGDLGGTQKVTVIGTALSPGVLNPSILLRGRLEVLIPLSPPSADERFSILKIHTANMPFRQDSVTEKEQILTEIAAKCHGYVGSDLRHLCTEAATMACVCKHTYVSREHFMKALGGGRPAALTSQAVGVIEKPKISLLDVKGCDEQISELKAALLLPLEHPKLLRNLGVKPPGGVLLYGPPGCGKTFLASAIASEARAYANFIPVSCTDLVDKVVGASEASVGRLFSAARGASPCILLLDHIDNIACVRGQQESSQATMDRVLSTLLVEMDGASSGGGYGVTVIATTHDKALLDPAILRPGRLDCHIYMGYPDVSSREAILEGALKDMPLEPENVPEEQTNILHTERSLIVADTAVWLANETEGYSPADLIQICQEAAMSALRENISSVGVSRRHFMSALLRR